MSDAEQAPRWMMWLAVVLTVLVAMVFGAPYASELIGAYW